MPAQAPPPADPAALALAGVAKTYRRRRTAVTALDGVDAEFHRGTFTAVMGPSGSGKSTFLRCAAGLERPGTGSVRLGGQELSGMRERELTRVRRARIGFVFQSFNLLPALTVGRNIELPLRLDGRRAARGRIDGLLELVGLAGLAGAHPTELSGGQQQRVAVARALVTDPEVVFADEPTAALDEATAAGVLGLLRSAVDELGATVVMVTHDRIAAGRADRLLRLDAGRVVADSGAAPLPAGVAA